MARNNKTIIFIVAGVVALAAILGGITYFVLRDNKEETPADNTQSTPQPQPQILIQGVIITQAPATVNKPTSSHNHSTGDRSYVSAFYQANNLMDPTYDNLNF